MFYSKISQQKRGRNFTGHVLTLTDCLLHLISCPRGDFLRPFLFLSTPFFEDKILLVLLVLYENEIKKLTQGIYRRTTVANVKKYFLLWKQNATHLILHTKNLKHENTSTKKNQSFIIILLSSFHQYRMV